jgi:uncharacterized membrane protein
MVEAKLEEHAVSSRIPTPHFLARGLLLIAMVCSTSHPARAAEFFDLSELITSTEVASVTALSPNGKFVVGRTESLPGLFGMPFIWSSDTGATLVDDGTDRPRAALLLGVSNDGNVAVGRTSSRRPFKWDPESGAQRLGGLSPEGDDRGSALGVSADGELIVGETVARQRVNNLLHNEAFIYSEETGLQALQSLAESSFHSSAASISPSGEFVAGVSDFTAFRWTEENGLESLGESPDGGASSASSVSDTGIVAGNLRRVGIGRRAGEAMLWTDSDGFAGLGDLAGGANPGNFRNLFSIASGISRVARVVVGQGSVQQTLTPLGRSGRPFIWTAAKGIQRLEYVLRDAGVALGWNLLTVAGVSENGRTLVGDGINPDGDQTGWMAVLPLPIDVEIRAGRRIWFFGARSHGSRIVLHASDFFDPSEVDIETLRFGRGSARALESPAPRIRGGGRGEPERLVVHFSTVEATLGLGAHSACVRGSTRDGTPFEGCARIDEERTERADAHRRHRAGHYRGHGKSRGR